MEIGKITIDMGTISSYIYSTSKSILKSRNENRLKAISYIAFSQTNNEVMNMRDNIKTSDFYFSAFLLSKGYELEETSKIGKSITFHFDSEGLEEVRNEYFLGKASVEPLSFQNAIHNLKTLTYNL